LAIDVLFYDNQGHLLKTAPYIYTASSTSWQPTGTVSISLFTTRTAVSAAPVAFRFTPIGSGAGTRSTTSTSTPGPAAEVIDRAVPTVLCGRYGAEPVPCRPRCATQRGSVLEGPRCERCVGAIAA
jgi:hypothetical protein